MRDVFAWRKVTLLFILLAIPFFFIGGPSSVSLDVYRRFWDLGHSIFFALVAINLVSWKIVKTPKQFLLAFVVVLLISLGIEKLQSLVGRDASWLDVLANMAGLLLGYSLTQSRHVFMLLLRGVSLLGLLPGLWGFLKSVAVTFIVWQQFPVLLSGEASWDQKAWGSDVHLQKMLERKGYQLDFSGKAFLSADMMGFIQSWSDYQSLVVDIENPSAETVIVVLRISDRQHALSEQDFNDRFNRRIALLPGSNRVKISVRDIQQSPTNRTMDLDDIYLLKLFLPEDGKPQSLYLHKLYLVRPENYNPFFLLE